MKITAESKTLKVIGNKIAGKSIMRRTKSPQRRAIYSIFLLLYNQNIARTILFNQTASKFNYS